MNAYRKIQFTTPTQTLAQILALVGMVSALIATAVIFS